MNKLLLIPNIKIQLFVEKFYVQTKGYDEQGCYCLMI